MKNITTDIDKAIVEMKLGCEVKDRMFIVHEGETEKAYYLFYCELKKLGYKRRHFNSNTDWSVFKKNWANILFIEGKITIQ